MHIIDLVGTLFDEGMDDENICLAVLKTWEKMKIREFRFLLEDTRGDVILCHILINIVRNHHDLFLSWSDSLFGDAVEQKGLGIAVVVRNYSPESQHGSFRHAFRPLLAGENELHELDDPVVKAGFQFGYLFHEILDLIRASICVSFESVVLSLRTDGEPFPVFGAVWQVIDHELSLHVMIESSVGDRERLPTAGTRPGEDRTVLGLIPHVGIEVDVDAVPAGEVAGVATGRAGNLVFTYLGHILLVFIPRTKFFTRTLKCK